MCASPRCMERRSAYCNYTYSGSLIPIRVTYSRVVKFAHCSVGVSIKIHVLLSLLAYTTLSEPATGFCHLTFESLRVGLGCEINL